MRLVRGAAIRADELGKANTDPILLAKCDYVGTGRPLPAKLRPFADGLAKGSNGAIIR